MSRKPPSRDIDENQLNVRHAKDHAAGPTAVAVTMKRAIAFWKIDPPKISKKRSQVGKSGAAPLPA